MLLCNRSALKNKPLVANISGLEYMNDDPHAVDVLYAKVSLTDGSTRYSIWFGVSPYLL